MTAAESDRGGDLFIVDNSDNDWKVVRYLRDWSDLSERMDIATGYFEIGALLALHEKWQTVDQIRVLMGDEVSRRTKKLFAEGLAQVTERLDDSLEAEKERNDFLTGVPAIAEAIRSGQISCRVYRKDKFHAKAYITHARQRVIGSSALVGSSNFTFPGLSKNVELNVQITGQPVTALQEWYERHWEEAEDVTPEILRTIERHIAAYSPFEVYAKSLQEFFRGHEMTVGEWEVAGAENDGSRVYPVLDQYQKEGYQALMKIARQYGGAFLCDGVGLGKTFIGLMVIERLIRERKRVALLVPKAVREAVWERNLKRYLPHLAGDFSNLVVYSHTDLGRGGDFPARFERIKEMADAIVIDEAHHFRNPGTRGLGEKRPSRYWQLYDLIDGTDSKKEMFFLTATPINNSLHDFRHMMELFTRHEEDYFGNTLGIHSLRGHFIGLDRHLRGSVQLELDDIDSTSTAALLAEAGEMLWGTELFRTLVVQRSRAYVKKSQEQEGGASAIFPEREPPRVAEYSVRKTYGKLLDLLEQAFEKQQPLFSLALYYPLAYYIGPDESIDPLKQGRQKQVVSLIRTQFLKRFESSAHAFERSCDRLLLKLLAWAEVHSETQSEQNRLDRWKLQNADLIKYVQTRQLDLWGAEDEEDLDDDFVITDEMLEDVEHLSRDEYRVEEILAETFLDLEQVARFIDELGKFESKHDDKLKALVRLVQTDPVLSKHKLLIFSEFADTARYLKRELQAAGVQGVEQIDSGTKQDRAGVITRFAPYYNDSSTAVLSEAGAEPIRVLISTDVLSEGLNLQDATRLINYDLHWNPVRLMQRIGRVDRRMDPEIEAQIVADHPDQAELRGKIAFWNFLPPDDLENLLRLYQRVSHKTLTISRTVGIEGRQLLKPDDEYDPLKDFNAAYEGRTSLIEDLHLEYQQMQKDQPDLAERLDTLPGRVFSGKEHPQRGTRAVFFCYRIKRPDFSVVTEGDLEWTEEAGDTRWLLYLIEDGRILEEPRDIVDAIRSVPTTPRVTTGERELLSEIRAKVEKHIKNTHLKRLQAPIGVKPILKTWLELS